MRPRLVEISFIIPSLNEAHNIANTLNAIHCAADKAKIDYEIIVVDHGSTDATRTIAASLAAKTITHIGGSIAKLRNIGAQRAEFPLLAFLDADVSLTNDWAHNIVAAASPMISGHKAITGSHCAPPKSSNNIFLKHWFSSLAYDPRNTHLGTGHMLITKQAFIDVGGFNESMQTGEDYEFCNRAKTKGYTIINNPKLVVIHHDFPTTIRSFIKREIWHAKGDLKNFSTMARSKVALGSIAFLTLHLTLLTSLALTSITMLSTSLLLLSALLLTSSLIKNRHSSTSTIIYNTVIFYFYYLGRTAALALRIIRRSH